jgi:hypothetical protein
MDLSNTGVQLFFGSITAVLCAVQVIENRRRRKNDKIVSYSGGCHCKAVTFTLDAPAHLIVWDCNCSICQMKKNLHFVVPKKKFKLLTGEGALLLYTYNTHTAKHYFCKHCGVQAFYVIFD